VATLVDEAYVLGSAVGLTSAAAMAQWNGLMLLTVLSAVCCYLSKGLVVYIGQMHHM